jgi:hypothetical protein
VRLWPQREIADALMDEYLSALGDFAGAPLGLAGADRMRGEAYAAPENGGSSVRMSAG